VLRDWQKGVKLGWVVGDVNYFAASAALTFPLGIYLLIKTRSRWEQVFCAGSLTLTLVAVIIGGSRGGFLGIGAGLLLMVWRSRRRFRNFVLVVALLLPLNLILPMSPLERLLHPSEGDQFGADSRIAIWRVGWQTMLTHPVFGVGLAHFTSQVQYGASEEWTYVAHNMYLDIAVELGVPTLLALLAMLSTTFRSLEAVRRRTATRGSVLLQQAALGMQAGLVGFAVAGFFVSAQYQKLFWLMPPLAACLDSLQRLGTRRKGRRPIPVSASRLRLHTPGESRPDEALPVERPERIVRAQPLIARLRT
jgi:O-antigen ligase